MTSSDTTSTLGVLGRLSMGRLHPSPESILVIGAHGSLDERGELVHAEDPAAQLALALALVEATLAGAGLVPADLAQLRVSATDLPAVLDVIDVLTDRFAEVGAAPALSVVGVSALPVEGMLVALDGLALGTGRRSTRVTPEPAGS